MLLKRTALLGLCGLAGAALLTGCKSSAPPPATIPTVPVATVGKATLANDLTLTAEFLPYQDVDVMAKVAGYVKTISVDIGDHVQQGQVLAVLEAPEIQSDVARAKAGVAAAEANIVTAQAAVQRAQAAAGIAKLSYPAHSGCSDQGQGSCAKAGARRGSVAADGGRQRSWQVRSRPCRPQKKPRPAPTRS